MTTVCGHLRKYEDKACGYDGNFSTVYWYLSHLRFDEKAAKKFVVDSSAVEAIEKCPGRDGVMLLKFEDPCPQTVYSHRRALREYRKVTKQDGANFGFGHMITGSADTQEQACRSGRFGEEDSD